MRILICRSWVITVTWRALVSNFCNRRIKVKWNMVSNYEIFSVQLPQLADFMNLWRTLVWCGSPYTWMTSIARPWVVYWRFSLVIIIWIIQTATLSRSQYFLWHLLLLCFLNVRRRLWLIYRNLFVLAERWDLPDFLQLCKHQIVACCLMIMLVCIKTTNRVLSVEY